ncbi:ABC transporter permease [Neobacillus sp. PS3-12]|uniref:ABC transporter permease n=1 Tax=Neobacillus sp. PS3-12 TaxID=3070677 RepID=UPI0027DF0B46|nr:ABC transporter permease [Neobacillus sp. PS3-12]WML54810.1 ABC transporter permease [Neobacillus sp. PS3-12]
MIEVGKERNKDIGIEKGIKKDFGLKKYFSSDINLTVLVILAIAIIIFLQLSLSPKIFSVNNLTSMAYQIPAFGFLALAMMLSMLTGGIDLSIISNANLSGIFGGFILTGAVFGHHSSLSPNLLIIIAIVAILVISTLLGLINGFLIAKLSVPPIIATLGTMLFYSGIGMAITDGQGIVGFPDGFLNISIGTVSRVPYIFIAFIVITVIVGIILSKTSFGKKVYLYGENNVATRFTAINNESLIIKVYSFCGLLSGIASIIMISSVNSAKVGYGDTFLLQALLVAVLGGVNPNGGRGRVTGVVLGIFILQILQSAFTFWQVTPYAKNLLWGSMLLIVLIVNFIIDKSLARKTR